MRILPVAFLAAAMAAGAMAADDKPKKKKDDPNQIGNRDIGKCLNFYSIEKEMALGKQAAEEVSRQARLNRDPLITEKVSRIGQNLVRSSDAKVPFTFQVIEDDAPNAFALPGGFVLVNTGLIKIATEEDEFAGAVAHEIAHVAARHMTCQQTKSQIASIASIPASIVLGGGWGGYAARQGMGVLIPTAFLKFSRQDESEADYLGTQYLYAAGYDPSGAISIFEKIEALSRTKPGFAARIFSTHPMDSDRIRKTQQEIEQILPAKSEYVVNTSEYMDVRDRVISRSKTTARPDANLNEDRPTLKRRELVQ